MKKVTATMSKKHSAEETWHMHDRAEFACMQQGSIWRPKDQPRIQTDYIRFQKFLDAIASPSGGSVGHRQIVYLDDTVVKSSYPRASFK